MTSPLTKHQRTALEAAENHGAAIYVRVSGNGGSFLRMCRRLAERGLLEPRHPYKITAAGRAALKWKDEKK